MKRPYHEPRPRKKTNRAKAKRKNKVLRKKRLSAHGKKSKRD